MIGRIVIKRAVKRAAGWAAVLTEMLTIGTPRPSACIFFYHRIADIGFVDSTTDDWNVPPRLLERQIATLAAFAELVPLRDLTRRLADSRPPTRPMVCLTFDDGYANLCTQALPILKRYDAPATFFVVTDRIGSYEPPPFDSWSQRNSRRAPSEAWRSMSWSELETCLASGLITIGAHSHRHLKGRDCAPHQLIEEAEASRAILQSRLGNEQAAAYAYPYGSTRLGYVPPAYVEAVRRAGYQIAVTSDLGLASRDSDPYRLPRIEAHAVDTPLVVRAKAAGAIAPYRLTDRLRTAERAV